MNIYNIKMSEYGIINFLEEYIEALKKPIRFKYTNADKIEMLKQTIELINEQHDKIEELKSRKYIFNAETNEIKEIPISDDYVSKDKIRHIRDKAECMDYYSLNDVIDDLSKLLGE